MDLNGAAMGSTGSPCKVGEVIEAQTQEFLAEGELHQPPPLGSLMRTREGEVTIYAVAGFAATGSREPGRQAIALGQNVPEEQVYRSHPYLEKLLRTTFTGLVVGHAEADASARYSLPPRPPHLHSFVYLCPPEEVRRFTSSLDFLDILASGGHDEALAACLLLASQAHPDPQAFLLRAGRELVPLFSARAGQLHSLLRRLKP